MVRFYHKIKKSIKYCKKVGENLQKIWKVSIIDEIILHRGIKTNE